MHTRFQCWDEERTCLNSLGQHVFFLPLREAKVHKLHASHVHLRTNFWKQKRTKVILHSFIAMGSLHHLLFLYSVFSYSFLPLHSEKYTLLRKVKKKKDANISNQGLSFLLPLLVDPTLSKAVRRCFYGRNKRGSAPY